MKIYVEKDKLIDNPNGFLRRAGYAFWAGRGDGQDSYARRLYGAEYPRLHLYVNDRGARWEFHLHLDQKKASYQGSFAHSGEYEGPVVEAEAERLRGLLGIGKEGIENNELRIKNKKEIRQAEIGRSAEEKLGQGDLGDVISQPKKKPFWRKLFS